MSLLTHLDFRGNAKSEQKNRKGGLSKSKKDYEMSQLVEETKLDLNQIKKCKLLSTISPTPPFALSNLGFVLSTWKIDW